ncbi:MAG: ABC transporter ATP-binding protein, partial [Phycicoccus sp.]|nr:ABC transporter ATP-binding protein [Phycicoccus sp.]
MTQTDLQTVGLDVQISGTPILRDVSLSVTRRELAVVIGPSGCGKSTLLRAIAGLRRASAGQILLGGEVVDDGMTAAPPERRRVGWVPQEAALFPHLTVAQNVAFGRGGRGGRGARLARVGGSDGEGSGLADRDLLDLTGLAALAERFPDQLSGGQAQRVALARALAAQPAVLLLDEPFAALDPTLRGELRDDLRRLLTALDVTALLVTHDQGEALELADTLVILREGQVIQHAAPERAYQHPATAWAASFLG